MDEEPRIHIGDVREAGHCVRGAKDWFAHYDLDFKAFLRDGILESDFLATGDEIARLIVDRKHGA